MNLKYLFKYLVLLLTIVFSINLNAQNKDDLVNLNTILTNEINNNSYNSFFEGTITLKDGDILTGKISLNNIKNQEYSAIYSQNGDWQYIPNHKIKKASLYSKNNPETKFYTIKDDDVMYREVYKKNEEIIVFDSSNKPFENRLISTVFIKDKDTLINTFDFWTSSSKKDLINYINNRDGVSYRNRDFKSLEELFEKL